MRSIIIGVLFLIGGLSGSLVLRGTGSSGALALVGLVMIVIGVIQVGNGNQGQASESFQDTERDQEQMEEYQRAKAENARKSGKLVLPDEVATLIGNTPGAAAQIDEVVSRTKGHLDAAQTQELVRETAKRLHDEHRRQRQAAGG
jgi:predicted homoserine dehydrogenase-like protein